LGYNESRGDYFAILPADDLFLPEKLQRQVEFLHDNPAIGAVGTYIQEINDEGSVCNEGSWIVPYINQLIDFKDLKNWRWRHYLCIPTAIYSRKLCEQAGAIPSDGMTNICDWDFHIRLLGVGTKMAVIPEVLTSYRWHGENTSKKRGDAFLQWTFSHVRNYVPILRKIAPDPRQEIQDCLRALYLDPASNYFVEDVPRHQLCAMLEALLDPEGGLQVFDDYSAFRRYAETWSVDSENRAALAALVDSLLELRSHLLAWHPQVGPDHLGKRYFPIQGSIISLQAELAAARAQLETLQEGSVMSFLRYALWIFRRRLRTSIRHIFHS
jgi:hypothetical protein